MLFCICVYACWRCIFRVTAYMWDCRVHRLICQISSSHQPQMRTLLPHSLASRMCHQLWNFESDGCENDISR